MKREAKIRTFGLACLLVAVLAVSLPLAVGPLVIPPEPTDQISERVPADGVFEGPRSGHWPAVRDRFVAAHPQCAACGTTKDLNVHHISPFHLTPQLELDPRNLIVLCREHHFTIGHHRNWKSSNPACVQEAESFRQAHPWK